MYHNNITNLIHFHNYFIVDPQLATSQQLQCTQLMPKTASVESPEDGRLTLETSKHIED
jgi:hypothetical protein